MSWQKNLEESGFATIEDVGLESPDKHLEEIVAAVSTPISYLGLPLVMDLKPQPGYQPASFAGTGEFNLHTDLTWHEKPPRYLGMFCIAYESAGGGIPLLADGWKALDDLSQDDLAYLHTEPVTFPPPDHIDYPPLSGPIITETEGKINIRFRYDLLANPDPTTTRFNQAINRHVFEVHVTPGSVFIFDNYRLLHGRTELKAGLGSDRHFKRMYGDV